MRLFAWLCLGLLAATVFHARLAAWPVAPDLSLALAAWAVVVGGERHWLWRVWLLGPLRDLIDPGAVWFHAGTHLVLVAALLPLRRWLPGLPWLALLVAGAGLSLLAQGVDALVSGTGGWSPWRGVADALLTGGVAVLCGRIAPGPKRTVVVEDEAETPVVQPERLSGS